MKIQMIPSMTLNTLEHVRRHIELEVDNLKVVGPKVEVHMTLSSGPKKSHHGEKSVSCDDENAPKAKKVNTEVKPRAPPK